MTRWSDRFFARCERLEGIAISEGAFSPGLAVWVGRREVAHFDSDGSLDVRLTRAEIRQRRTALGEDPRVVLRRSGSDWLAVRVDSADDLELALALVADAVTANEPYAEPGPPPGGAELERRRRFH